MKSVLLSVKPKYCELIANSKKTIEIRKINPKLKVPFKVYIYCTKDKENILFKDWIDPPFVVQEYNIMQAKGIKNVFGDNRPWGNANGKVIGEFVCNKITGLFNVATDSWECLAGNVHDVAKKIVENDALLSESELHAYANGKNCYGWHISGLKIYDKPTELSKFGINRPPQSWRYVEIKEADNADN